MPPRALFLWIEEGLITTIGMGDKDEPEVAEGQAKQRRGRGSRKSRGRGRPHMVKSPSTKEGFRERAEQPGKK